MSLTGNAAIPAPYRQRSACAYKTGQRIVGMVDEDLRPSKVMTRQAFENVIKLNTALGGSTNAPPHIIAVARHAGVKLDISDWQTYGYDLPLLVNLQPAGKYLGESFFSAGGVAAVMSELLASGNLDGDVITVTGNTMAQNIAGLETLDEDVIFRFDKPVREQAGFMVLSGNLFTSALMKTSVISDDFRQRFLSTPSNQGVFEATAIIFEGPEDYHRRINAPELNIDDGCMLFIRGVGPVGYPGAEVVNMQPPDYLLQQGVMHLPTVGDGRQSGTSESPSILNASPESVVGDGLAILQTGDTVRLNLNNRSLDLVLSAELIQARWDNWSPPQLENRPRGNNYIAPTSDNWQKAVALNSPPAIGKRLKSCPEIIIEVLCTWSMCLTSAGKDCNAV